VPLWRVINADVKWQPHLPLLVIGDNSELYMEPTFYVRKAEFAKIVINCRDFQPRLNFKVPCC
jgi:hypothetical protein